jgi:uncharacterized membrane protein
MPTGTTKVGNLTYNVAALLCYLPLFGISLFSSILWLVTEPPESKFVRFHAIQSLTFIGVTFGLMIGLGCCSGVLVPMAGSAGGQSGAEIGGIIVLVVGLFQLAYLGVWLILHVWLMIKAYNNEAWKVPVIGNLAASSTGIGG